MISQSKLIQVEFVARSLMSLILLTAGISKLFSNGGFKEYYEGLFANPSLRINVPDWMISLYLSGIPFIEIGLGVCLLFSKLKSFTVYAWYMFMASLLVGHYILQEWSAVNQMLAYFFLGMVCHLLPCRTDLSNSNHAS